MAKRILLIDSDEQLVRTLKTALAARGLIGLSANDSERGLVLAKNDRPDVIVVSVEAQPTNGYMVCKRLKESEQLKKIPVVIISSNATADSFEKHKKLKTRAEEYLIKPFAPDALMTLIGKLLKLELPPAPVGDHEDEPLGLGALVDEDEPVQVVEAGRTAEHGSVDDGEDDNVDVEEILEEEPVVDLHEDEKLHTDLDLLDAAFKAISPAVKSAPPPAAPHESQASEEIVELGEDELAPPTGEQSALSISSPETQALLIPDTHALEARVHELEAQLIQKEAELEAARQGQTPSAELRKVKEARSKADKENVQLKEELNAKERELIELRDQQSALEHQAQTLQDDAVKREVAAKSLQQRAEALAAAAKKFERELTAAREELKSVATLKAKIAEQESAHAALERSHTEASAEAAQQSEQRKSLEQQLAAKSSAADESSAQLKSVKEDLARAQAAQKSAESALAAANTERQQVATERDSARTESTAALAKLETARSLLAQAQKEMEKSRTELAAQLTARDELRQQLADATSAAARHEQNAAEAQRRVTSDSQAREKARQALQSALELLAESAAPSSSEAGAADDQPSA